MTVAKQIFEKQWETSASYLWNEVNNCTNYEIYDVIKEYLRPEFKILENGCGKGKWVIHFSELGYDIEGLDWSQETINKLLSVYPKAKCYVKDSRNTEFENNRYDIILSFGTFEHVPEGPQKAIMESLRILKRGGILICTMPYYSPFLRVKVLLKEFYRKIKYDKIKYRKYREDKMQLNNSYDIYPSMIHFDGELEFFEYYFSSKQFKKYFSGFNVKIIKYARVFKNDGLFFVFGSLIGKWDYSKGVLVPNYLGKILLRIIPSKLYALHNLMVLEKLND